MAIKLYPHNQETYAKVVTMFETSNRVGIVQPTGTGKSFIYLKWIEDNPDDTFIIIAPSTEIFVQLQEYANEAGLLHLLDRATMLTYQKLLCMTEDELRALRANKIIVDEFHRGGAKQWEIALLVVLDCNPGALVLGTSATPVRYLDDARDMASELFDSNLAVEMTLGEAVVRNILPEPEMIAVWYDLDGCRIARYKEDIATIQDKKKRKEAEETLEKMRRHMEDAYGIEKVLKNHLHGNEKLIVFCRNKEHLECLQAVIAKWFIDINPNVHIYKSIADQKDKNLQLQSFCTDQDDAIKLLMVIDRLNEGLHVKDINGVILLRPTTSPIVYLQQIGRTLATGCQSPLIFDFVNNYQSARINLNNGIRKNVFQQELDKHKAKKKENKNGFNIFESVIQFQTALDQLENTVEAFITDEKWTIMYDLYIEYKKHYGKEPHQNTIYKGLKLGLWCSWQRLRYREGTLKNRRKELLINGGFVFEPWESQWEECFALLIDYREKYGNIPTQKTIYCGKRLGMWYLHQKKKHKKGTLSANRAARLINEGFDLSVTKSQPDWNEYFCIYSQYKAEYGCEPQFETKYKGYSIGYWCSTQRTCYKKGELDINTVNQLIEAGFVFDLLDAKWEYMLSLYMDYKKKYKYEPARWAEHCGKKLGKWCMAQRTAHNKGKLSSEHIQRLNDADFAWVLKVNDAKWEHMFSVYMDFKREYGRNPKGDEEYSGEKLAQWCRSQRSSYKHGSLSAERIQKLSDAGFVWDPKGA